MITSEISPKILTKRKSIVGKFKKEFLSRNLGLITDDLQKKIRKTKLLFIGCGLTSQAAILAARAGFENFILCDGDNIEISNLNRQAFDLSDLGKNKAVATKEKILRVNPMCKVKAVKSFVRQDLTINRLIKSCDIVINSADPDESIYLINDTAQKEKKLVLFPMTFGFGGYLLIFKSKSKKLDRILGEKIIGWQFFTKLIEKTTDLPDKIIQKIMSKYLGCIKENGYVPQLGQSAYLVSAMILASILNWIDNKSIITAPKAITIDPFLGNKDKFLL